MIVQSFSPDHYAVETASRHDYEGFYRTEIAHREELSYPPFSRLISLVWSDPVDGYAESRLRELTDRLRERVRGEKVSILGPSASSIARLKGLYRWRALMKIEEGDPTPIVKQCVNELPTAERAGLTVDVDPMTMI